MEDNGRTTAIVSYITLIGWLVAYFGMHKSNPTSLGAFHLRQSLGIMLLAIAVNFAMNFLYFIPGFYIISPIISLIFLVLWILGLVAAVNSQEKGVPLVGDLFQSSLKGIQ